MINFRSAIYFFLALILSTMPLAAATLIDEILVKAESGDPYAQTTLGVCYELGQDLPKNLELAIKWYEKAAEHGWPGALVRLGRCYAEGIGVSKNLQKAAALWLQAARMNARPRSTEDISIQEARALLSRALRLGEGTEKDVAMAIKVATPAAEWGLPAAEYELAMSILATGDVQKAEDVVYWLKRAASGGSQNALEELDKLGKKP